MESSAPPVTLAHYAYLQAICVAWVEKSNRRSRAAKRGLFDGSLGSSFNGTAGGVDDRYDVQLASRSILDGTLGLLYASNGCYAFGHNGSKAMGTPITTGTGAAPDVLQAIEGIVDHLPVLADYLLRPRPGKMYPGDTNLDRTVTLDDFAAMASNFGSTDASWQRGDRSGDAAVTLDVLRC